MNKNTKRIQIRADSETLEKINYIAEFYGRTVKELIIHLIDDCVSEYENKVGTIEKDSSNEE